jgi:hypothetical protein
VLDINRYLTERLTTDHLNTGFLGFSLSCPESQVANACFSCNPPDLNFSKLSPGLWRPSNILSKLRNLSLTGKQKFRDLWFKSLLLRTLIRRTSCQNLETILKSDTSSTPKWSVAYLRGFTLLNKALRSVVTSVNIFQSTRFTIPDGSIFVPRTCSFTFLFFVDQICKHKVTSALNCCVLHF